MKQVSDKALLLMKKNNVAIGKLMIAFNKGQQTILNWMDSKDVRLTTPTAVEVIREETGLSDEEILEPEDKDTTVTA